MTNTALPRVRQQASFHGRGDGCHKQDHHQSSTQHERTFISLSRPRTHVAAMTRSFYLQPVVADVFAAGTEDAAPTSRPPGGVTPKASRGSPARGRESPSRALSPDPKRSQRITAVTAYGNNVYVAASSGQIAWYTLESSQYTLQKRHHLVSGQPVSKLYLLPRAGKIGVLGDDGVLVFLSLPALEPVPLNPIKGVLFVALDDQEVGWRPSEDAAGGGHKVEDMALCVVKRNTIMLYKLGAKLTLYHDIPIPETPTQAVRSGDTLCISDFEKYCIVDLKDNHLLELLPISQTEGEDVNARPNIAVVPGVEEFLFSSYTGSGSLGVFVSKEGDPVRGTIDWPSPPTSLAIDDDSIIAVLNDGNVVIHSIAQVTTQDGTPQVISATGTLASNPYGFLAPHSRRDGLFRPKTIMVDGQLKDTDDTPPSSTTVAETLIVQGDQIQALVAESWLSQAEQLLAANKVEACAKLAEDERKKAKRGEIEVDKSTHTADLRLVWTRLALAYFADAMFDEAGQLFLKAKVDPRVVIRLFPGLVESGELTVWQGFAKDAVETPNVEEAVERRLKQVYSESSDESEELKRQMTNLARTMLVDFLRKTRLTKRKPDPPRDTAIDTCLAKLLASRGESEELLALLTLPNSCSLEELELAVADQPDLLLTVLRMRQSDRLIDVLISEVDRRQDPSFSASAVDEVFRLLQASEDSHRLRSIGLWLMQKSPSMGFEIFTSQHTRSICKFDEKLLIDEMRAIDEHTSNRYLEFVVVHRRSVERPLHDALADHLLSECEQFVKDDGVMYHFREIFDEYLLTRPHLPYCQYIGEMAYESPSKDTRLKTILFLQGSPFYDLKQAEERLEKIELLFYEHAIVLGRLGQHERALELLAVKLKDSVSAEMYCTQGGEVVPPKIARAMTKKVQNLQAWAVLGELGRRRKGTIEGDLRERLVMNLLQVYMRGGPSEAKQTAELLNAQALHLDDEQASRASFICLLWLTSCASQILKMLPNDWSLEVVSAFIGRSLKRGQHERVTWQSESHGNCLPCINSSVLRSPQGHVCRSECSNFRRVRQDSRPSPTRYRPADRIQPTRRRFDTRSRAWRV